MFRFILTSVLLALALLTMGCLDEGIPSSSRVKVTTGNLGGFIPYEAEATFEDGQLVSAEQLFDDWPGSESHIIEECDYDVANSLWVNSEDPTTACLTRLCVRDGNGFTFSQMSECPEGYSDYSAMLLSRSELQGRMSSGELQPLVDDLCEGATFCYEIIELAAE